MNWTAKNIRCSDAFQTDSTYFRFTLSLGTSELLDHVFSLLSGDIPGPLEYWKLWQIEGRKYRDEFMEKDIQVEEERKKKLSGEKIQMHWCKTDYSIHWIGVYWLNNLKCCTLCDLLGNFLLCIMFTSAQWRQHTVYHLVYSALRDTNGVDSIEHQVYQVTH